MVEMEINWFAFGWMIRWLSVYHNWSTVICFFRLFNFPLSLSLSPLAYYFNVISGCLEKWKNVENENCFFQIWQIAPRKWAVVVCFGWLSSLLMYCGGKFQIESNKSIIKMEKCHTDEGVKGEANGAKKNTK